MSWHKLIFMAVMLPLTACAGGERAEVEVGEQLELEELARGTQSRVSSESMTVIRDAEAFEGIWRQAGQRGEPPAVDFEQFMVIAAFMGERRTGGYTVRVRSAERNEEGLKVRVRMEAPGRNCMVTQAFTQPFHLVRLPRVEGAVDFEVNQETVDC
ncbi:protease complex subunit PrcB family protein [Gammaproteobacteria bacterium AB-CW1]|uniref:Protease complex subunit PrcB family protein n=1 Tax=Natronospira elongata TaxID=3110268 RepID=A0AAP6JE42_9GAMM|nr:protease complex subunit PrcB family protein [Gammaproteobacteria bacterium AB-CW1]